MLSICTLTQFQKKLVRRHKVGGIALTMCCNLKVRRLFSSLSREMLTFSRLIQHNIVRINKVLNELKQLPFVVKVFNESHYSGFWKITVCTGWTTKSYFWLDNSVCSTCTCICIYSHVHTHVHTYACTWTQWLLSELDQWLLEQLLCTPTSPLYCVWRPSPAALWVAALWRYPGQDWCVPATG